MRSGGTPALGIERILDDFPHSAGAIGDIAGREQRRLLTEEQRGLLPVDRRDQPDTQRHRLEPDAAERWNNELIDTACDTQ